MTSLRLSSELEDKLNRIAKNEKISKSEIVKRALVRYFEDYQNMNSSFDLGEEYFGKYGSGNGNLSRDYKKILKAKLNEKHSR